MSTMNSEGEWTPEEGKFVAVVVSMIVVAAIAFIFFILWADRKNADSIEKDAAKEEREVDEMEQQEEIDELCGVRLTKYTVNGTLDLEQFLYAYGFAATENGWVGDNGCLLFDYSTNENAPTIRYKYDEDDANEYERTVSYDPAAVDNVPVKIGARSWTMSRDDITALGRIIMKDPSDFTLISE